MSPRAFIRWTLPVAATCAGLVAAALAASGPAAAAATTPEGSGLVVTARTADPADPRVVLTNQGTEPCQVPDTVLGTVALTRVDQDQTSVEPMLVEVNVGEAVDRYLADRLRVLAPGETLEVPLRVVPVGPTGAALETVVWSSSIPPIGSLHPIAPERPLEIEFTYAVPVVAPDGQPPVCAPAAGASGLDGRAGPPWLLLVAVAAGVLLLIGLVAVMLVARRRRAGPAAAAAVLVLLAAALVAADWSTTPHRAHATIDVSGDLAGAWADCSAVFNGPGGDPGNILPTLDGDGVQVRIIPANGDQTHHTALNQNEHFVFWNTANSHTYHGNGGAADPCSALYHELYHAYESHRGELDTSDCVTAAGNSGIPISEVNAVRVQNQLRNVLGLRERDHYGDRPLPSGECLPPDEQPESPENPQCSGRGCGDSNGDPHLVTFDGTRYSFQAVGEFVAANHPDQGFQVQVRQEPVSGSRLVSVNTAVAFDVDGDRVEVRVGDPAPVLVVAGEVREEQEVSLPAGGVARQVSSLRGQMVAVTWPDGSTAAARTIGRWGLHLTVQPAEPRAGKLSGLLGDFDGDPANDLRPRGGDPLPLPPTFEAFYPDFADSWRVDSQTSLFTYPPGAGPETYADPTFPDRQVTVDELPNRAWAQEVCRRTGVSEPGALRDCTLDVALTGQPDFATAARATQVFLDVFRPEGPGTLLTVDTPGGSADLTFHASAGEKVFIDMGWTDLPANCFPLTLLAPDGRQLGSGCAIDNRGHIDAAVLPEDGEYTVRFRPSGGATGQARVWVIRAHDQEGLVTLDGPAVTAEIEQPGAVARFNFRGQQGQKVFVDVSDSTLDAQCYPLRLLAPDGTMLGSGCVISGQGYIDVTELPETGDYTVLVDPADRHIGRTTLRVLEAVDQQGTITVGGPEVTAVIGQPGAVTRLTFNGTAGQLVDVEVTGSTLPSQCFPLRLHDPDGAVIATGCVIGGRGDIAATTLPVTGQYTLVVDPHHRTVGEVQLLLR